MFSGKKLETLRTFLRYLILIDFYLRSISRVCFRSRASEKGKRRELIYLLTYIARSRIPPSHIEFTSSQDLLKHAVEGGIIESRGMKHMATNSFANDLC